MASYWMVKGLALTIRYLPLRLSYGLATLIGYIVYLFWPQGRANTIDNMRHVFGQDADERLVRRTARQSICNYMKVMVDFIRLPLLSRNQMEELITSSGWEHLDKAFERGRGVILVAAHFGNWDLGGLVLAMRSYPINAVTDSFGSKGVDRLVRGLREAWGIQVIPIEYALRRIYVALRHNEAVGLLADRPSGDNGVPVHFFNSITSWPAGAATLALRTGAEIILGYLVRRADNTYEGEMKPLGEVPLTGNMKQDVQIVTQRIVSMFEELIRQYPDQWYMFRRMWPEASSS